MLALKIAVRFARVFALGIFVFLAVGNAPAATTNTTKAAAVQWNPSSDSSVSGYAVYYGTSSGNYSARLDVGTNVSATVAGLQGGKSYYFVATAYNDALVESAPSTEAAFISNTNPVPVLGSVTNQFVNVLDPLRVANNASEAGLTAGKLAFSLDPGAPPRMFINRTNGLVRWIPGFEYAGTTNLISVRVTDNHVPPSSAVQTFNVVVGHAGQLSFSNAVLTAGSTGSVYLTLAASINVTNLTFTLDAPTGKVSNITIVSLLPAVVSAVQSPAGNVHSTVTVKSINGQPIPTSQAILKVNFTAVAGQHSSFAPWLASSVSAIQGDGQPLPRAFGAGGRAVVIGPETLVEALVDTNGHRNVILYGPLGANYALESTTRLTTNTTWTPVFTGTLTNLTQSYSNVSSPGTVIFYRGHAH